MTGHLFIAFLIVALTYIWLGYAMNSFNNPLLAMVVYYPVLCLGGGYLLNRLSPVRPSTTHPQSRPLIHTLVLSTIATVVLWACMLLFRPGILDPEFVTNGLEVCGMYRETYWQTAIGVVLVNPVFEELLWRWGLVSFLDSRFPRTVTVQVSAILFAGYHPIVVALFFPKIWLLGVFAIVYIGGIVFANLYLRTRNLLYPIILHVIVNINLMLMGYIFAP